MSNYEIKTDVEATTVEDVHGEWLIEAGDVLHIGEATDRDLLDAAGETDFNPGVMQATEEEHAEWNTAFRRFADQMKKASGAMQKAIADLEAATEHIRKVAQEAWKDYEPVHLEISSRMAAVEKLRDQDAEEKDRKAQAAAEAALAAEDAKLGPRLLLVTRPSQRGQNGPKMDAPTIHHVDCSTVKRLKCVPDPVRVPEAFEALMDGGLMATKQFYTWEPNPQMGVRVPGSACERCQAFTLLRSHAPDTFMDWLERTEKEQRPAMPPATYKGNKALFENLGLGQVSYDASQAGWARVSDNYYRAHNAMADDEILIGWVEKGDDGKRRVSSDVEKLKPLFDLLPPRGVEVRWVHEPSEFYSDGKVSPYSVAIRFMSKWAKRNYVGESAE